MVDILDAKYGISVNRPRSFVLPYSVFAILYSLFRFRARYSARTTVVANCSAVHSSSW